MIECKITRNTSYAAAMNTVSNDICHWKYIKREKVNGKWKYYYDANQLKDDLGFDEREAVMKQKYNMNTMKALSNIKKDEATQAYDRMFEPSLPKEIYNIRKKNYDEAANAYIRADANYWDQKHKTDSLIAKYEKTPIGKIESTVNKGKNFIKNFFGMD